MRTLICNSTGSGAIIGARLITCGGDVTFLDETRRAFTLDRTPLMVKSLLGGFKQVVRPLEPSEVRSPFHLIIVCNPADEIPALAEILDRGLDRGTTILSLADGLEHVSLLERNCPAAMVLDGATDIVGQIDDSGTVNHFGAGTTIDIAARTSSAFNAASEIQRFFAGTGTNVDVVEDVAQKRMERAIRLTAAGGVAALMRASIARIASVASGTEHIWRLTQEVAIVAATHGHRVDVAALAEFACELPHVPTANLRRLIDEISRCHFREITELVRQFHDNARAKNLPTPLLDVVHGHLQAQAVDENNRTGDQTAAASCDTAEAGQLSVHTTPVSIVEAG